MTQKTTNDVVYLLGFSPQTPSKICESLCGLIPSLKRESFGGIDSWFVRVPRHEFEGSQAEKNLADVKWLSPRVMAHQDAVGHLASELPFYPAKFGTLFSSMEKLGELIGVNRTILLTFFAEDARHVEWGVKFFVAWPRAVEAFQETLDPSKTREETGKGLSYLRKKQMIRYRDQAVRKWLDSEINLQRQELDRRCVRCCERPIRMAIAEGDWECVTNLSVLINRSAEASLDDWVGSVNGREDSVQRLQLSGPWPLYSFAPALESLAGLDHDADAA